MMQQLHVYDCTSVWGNYGVTMLAIDKKSFQCFFDNSIMLPLVQRLHDTHCMQGCVLYKVHCIMCMHTFNCVSIVVHVHA